MLKMPKPRKQKQQPKISSLSASEQMELMLLLQEEEQRKTLIAPHPSNLPQQLAVTIWSDWMFYGGAAGGGKSFYILILAMTQHQRSVIYRRTYPQTMELREKLRSIVSQIPNSRIIKDSTEFYFWGKTIHIRSLKDWSHVEGMQGNTYDLMAFDECTHFPLEWIKYLSTWNRTTLPNQRCRIVLTSNPPTSNSGKWVGSMFAKWVSANYSGKRGRSGEIAWFININNEQREVDGPQTVIAEDGEAYEPYSVAFVQARLSDNIFLGDDYRKRLDLLPDAYKRAFKDGDWGVMDADDIFQIFPSRWIEIAREKGREMKQNGTWGKSAIEGIGCDVAISADRSAQAYFDGRSIRKVVRVIGSHTPTGHDYCEWVKSTMAEFCIGYLPRSINVDGANLAAGEIMEKDAQLRGAVRKWLFQWGSTIDRDRSGFFEHGNIKAQAFDYLAWLFNPSNPDSIALDPDDEELALELKSILWADNQRSDKRFVEDKEGYIKRVGKSPDLVDACVFAIMHRLAG